MSTKTFPSNGKETSSEDDVMQLLSGGEIKPHKKEVANKSIKEVGKPVKEISSQDDVMDLLSGTVKKKDTESDSGAGVLPSTSPSPVDEAKAAQAYQDKKLTQKDFTTLAGTDWGKKNGLSNIPKSEIPYYVDKHNGLTKADLVQNIQKNVFDELYPISQDPAQNQMRRNLMEQVYTGNQEGIKKVKQAIGSYFDDKIAKATSEQGRIGPGHVYDPARKKNIEDLKGKQKNAIEAIDNYGMATLAAEPLIRAFDKDIMISSEEAGKQAEKYYGLANSSGNIKYERTKTGMSLKIQNIQMEINDLMSKGMRTKNQELLDLGEEKRKQLTELYDVYNKLDTEQFPDVGKANTARWIGENYSAMFPGYTEITPQGVKAVAAKIAQDDPDWMNKYGKFIDEIADSESKSMMLGIFKRPGLVPRGDFAGALERGSEKAAIGALKTRADIFGYEKDKPELDQWEKSPRLKGTAATGEAPNKIVYDSEGKAYRELPNEHYGKLDWNNFTRFAGESLPGLAAWMIPETAGVRIAEAVGLGKNASRTVGLLAASYATQYDSNLKNADEIIGEGGSVAKKKILANATTVLTAATFQLFGASPTKMATEAISKGVIEDGLKEFAANDWKDWSENQTYNFVKNSILPRVKAIVKTEVRNLKSGVILGAASVTDEKIRDMVNTLINPDTKQSTPQENATTFGSQVMLMSIVGLPGIVKSGIESPSLKDAMYDAGTYPSQYIDKINGMLDRGEIDPKQGNQAIAAIKTMSEEVENASSEKDDEGRPLPTKAIKEIAIAGFRKRAAKKLEEDGHDTSKAQGESDSIIKESKKEESYFPIEETETFKSIKSEDGTPAQKITDIDPAKNYEFKKGEETVTENGASLINHLQNGDIYEPEISKSAEGKSAEGQDTKGEDQKLSQDKKAKTVVDQATKDKQIPGVYLTGAAQDPAAFLKEIYGQVTGTHSDSSKSEIPDAEKATREQFGNQLVDAAKEMYGTPKVVSAVIEVGGKIYEGKNHGEAIDKATAAGEDMSQIDRDRDGKFRTSDGRIIDRQQAREEFGAGNSEQLIPQDVDMRSGEEKNKLLDEKISKDQGKIRIDKGAGRDRRADLEIESLKNRHRRLQSLIDNCL